MIMKIWKKLSAAVCVFAISIQITGCSSTTPTKPANIDTSKEQASFDEYVNDLFVKEVQSDSITLNYTLQHPENYGITDFKPTLGTADLDSMKEDLVDAENVISKLQSFSYDALTKEQQLTYDVLIDSYTVDDKCEDYLLYGESLRNSTGIQAELPILLSEYKFSDAEDIDDYITLLGDCDNYFEQIMDFEKDKSEAGLFMSDENADQIISQCEDFIKEPDHNLLLTTFDERIDNLDWLSKAEKKNYKKENEKAVQTEVIPAYQKLIDSLSALKGSGKYEGGIGNLPDGKAYYEWFAQNSAGTSMRVSDMKKALNKTQQAASTRLGILLAKDSDLWEDYVDMKFPMTEPNEILSHLEKATQKDFPSLGDINYTVKYVDKSLEDHVSPAFYLTPQFDNYKENSIYINGSKDNDLTKIFTTLAHEGFPGHLLQTVYYQQQDPSPIRMLLNYGGYSEGWATYCEMLSYDYSTLDKDLSDFAKQYDIFNLCMYAQMDIGVNYDCWTKDELADFLKGYGVEDKKVVNNAYNIVVDDPANYLKYVIGYIEFENLRDEAENKLDDDFNAKNFHTFLLKTGPCSFPILKDYMKDWMKTQK